MKKILKVNDSFYGETEVNIERIVALVPNKKQILFEGVAWTLNEDDFNKVSDAWHELLDENKEENGTSVAESFARIIRGNLGLIDVYVVKKLEDVYLKTTGHKMFGGFKD